MSANISNGSASCKPFQHVIENLSDIIASEALTLHLLIIVHFTFTNFAVVKLVPLGWLVSSATNQIVSQAPIADINRQLFFAVNTRPELIFNKIL